MINYLTIGQMLEKSVSLYPRKVAIVHRARRIKYCELNEIVNQLANGLIGLGLGKGDRVCALLPRCPELVISFLATAKAGGILVPLNFEEKAKELESILQTVSPTVLILHKDFLPIVDAFSTLLEKTYFIVVGADDIKKSINCLSTSSSTDLNQRKTTHIFSFLDFCQKGSSSAPQKKVYANDVVYFNYTSGSTGKPKAAMATHSNIIWNTISAVNTLGLEPTDIHLIMFAPYAHPHELFARPIYLGGTLVLLEDIYPRTVAKTITEEQVTCMMALSPIYEMLLKVAGLPQYDFSSLWLPESGGMSVRFELINNFENLFHIPIIQVWGSTETTGIALANPVHGKRKEGSIGKPCLYYDVKVVNDEGEEVGPHQAGEMAIRGPAVVENYFSSCGEIIPATLDGWYYTGDMVVRDEEGFFYFMGRKHNMLKVGGMKVYTAEIENLLQKHPKVSDAVVVKANDSLRGEVPKAIIVLKEGKTATASEIKEFCLKNLANYKVPRIIEFWSSLPRMSSGKINRKALEKERSDD